MSKKEINWINRLQKLLDKQPKTLIAYCTGIQVNFYKANELPTYDGNYDSPIDGSVDSTRVKTTNWESGAY